MKESVPVHERKAGKYLYENHFNCVFREVCVSVFDQLIEILVHVFKHKVENVILTDYFLQFDNIGMGELFQGLKIN
jgi:hypothetical protein